MILPHFPFGTSLLQGISPAALTDQGGQKRPERRVQPKAGRWAWQPGTAGVKRGCDWKFWKPIEKTPWFLIIFPIKWNSYSADQCCINRGIPICHSWKVGWFGKMWKSWLHIDLDGFWLKVQPWYLFEPILKQTHRFNWWVGFIRCDIL